MPHSQDTELQTALEAIQSQANQQWEQERALLLSSIGSMESGSVSRLAKLNHTTVRGFVEQHLAEHCVVRAHSRMPARIGILPKNLESAQTNTVDHWLRLVDAPVSTPYRRYLRVFWTAFRKPLIPGETRYISVQHPVVFKNLPADDPAPQNMFQITPEYIADDTAITDDQVEENIQKWCELNDLDSQSFLMSSTGIGPGKDSRIHHQISGSVLVEMIERLSEEELKHVTLPLKRCKKAT